MNLPPPSGLPPDGTEMIRAGADATDSERCRRCGGARPARADFCETCGAAIDERASIVVDVFADRNHFDTIDQVGLEFPVSRRVRTLWFDGDVVNVGRRRTNSGPDAATPRIDVDLSGDLADPAASQRHCQLVRHVDGRWELIDVGSTNGTTLNESTTPLGEGSAVAVSVGDHIHVGAWTTIVIRSVTSDQR